MLRAILMELSWVEEIKLDIKMLIKYLKYAVAVGRAILGRDPYRLKKHELSSKLYDNSPPPFLEFQGKMDGAHVTRYIPIADTFHDRRRFHLQQEEMNDLTLLDLGCSYGIAAHGLKELLKIKGYNPNIIGIDPLKEHFTKPRIGEETGLELLCRRHTAFGDSGIDHEIQGVAQYIPLGKESIDYVIFYKVAEFFSTEDRLLSLREIVRVLKPSGIAYIGIEEPNKGQRNLKTRITLESREVLQRYLDMLDGVTGTDPKLQKVGKQLMINIQ